MRRPRRSGEIGRRAGFKIRFWRQSVGSSPTFGTTRAHAFLWGATAPLLLPTSASATPPPMTRIPFRELPDAELWRRLVAALYDGLLLLALWFVLGLIAAIIFTTTQHTDTRGTIEPLVPAAQGPWVTLPLLWLSTAIFYGWFWRHGGQTLGMKTWRLRLVTVDDRPLTWSDCFARCAAASFSWLLMGAGYLWVLFKKRSWHDLATRTRVVVIPKDAK